ncbi:Glycosyl hydrolase family 20, catalytic domain [Bryocella elongata]|uniref:beta-N-acetylhexosaminidase n=1 Tax=Bryocella elongata TaxID=863522 RepID=A0A1H5US70_9BACT|nr:beta-N-acetylhexosaminidase [Bryocella elongata]SEF77268.1 Glycosyl hydrolase family 20, catalytic domain [Bryocella elongata]
MKKPSRTPRCLWLVIAASLVCGPRIDAQPADAPQFLPAPREWHANGTLALPEARITVPGHNPEDEFAASELRAAFLRDEVRVSEGRGYTITLLREGTPEATAALRRAGTTFDSAMKDEGYVIVADGTGAAIVAHTANGIFYGVQTLAQMVLPSHQLALGVVRDWPAMRWRGVDDDLSRGPVPTIAFQKRQLDLLASYKVNIYSPYLESTLAYKGHLMVPPPGSALTPADAAELVSYAAERHILIVPEQEAFGHLHHVLQFDRYAELAESPHGHVLAPGQPGTLPLIKDWFSQAAAEFPGPFLHIGADETFDLGIGRTKDAVTKRGLGPVYADFLTQIHAELAPLNRRLLFWGDLAWSDTKAIGSLPKDMIAVPWIYWHQDNYDSNITPFRDAGIETWVAPGDANWNVVYPIGATVLDNVSGFVEAGQRLGSTGELMTVWNDDGEGLFNEDWFGVLFGAAASWQPARIQPEPYQRAFGLRFYNDASGRINQAQLELMAAQKLIDTSDAVFWMDPWSEEGEAFLARNRTKLQSARVHAERALELLLEVAQDTPALREPDALQAMELGARRIDFLAQKFEWSDDIAAAYARAYALRNDKEHATEAREALYSISSMNGRCQDLRDGYSLLKTLYTQSWLAENRPYWLENVTVRYDLRIQLWQQRGERIDAVINKWQKTHQLPAPADLGLPANSSDEVPVSVN